jgi:hypothetical protein
MAILNFFFCRCGIFGGEVRLSPTGQFAVFEGK